MVQTLKGERSGDVQISSTFRYEREGTQETEARRLEKKTQEGKGNKGAVGQQGEESKLRERLHDPGRWRSQLAPRVALNLSYLLF